MSSGAKTIRAQAQLWCARKDDGLSASEEAELQSWLDQDPAHVEAFAEAMLLWEATGLPGYADDLRTVMAELEEQRPVPIQTTTYQRNPWAGRFLAAGMALAASVVAAVFVVAPEVFLGGTAPEIQRFATDDGTTKRITLPDKSTITLGPKSVLEFQLAEHERRGVLIEGDAFFDVVSDKQKPFIVATDFAEVEVTGTKFDMQLQTDGLSVAVGEGSVRVEQAIGSKYAESPQSLALLAGQAVEILGGSGFGEITEVYPAELGAWRRGQLIFRNTPLSEVVSDLNRYGDVPVSLDPRAANLTVSGTFNANNLEFLFEGMQKNLPVRIEQSESEITIKSR